MRDDIPDDVREALARVGILGTEAAALPEPVDWTALAEREAREEVWAIPGVLPAGRAGSLTAKAKEGKSLLSLDLLALAQAGRSVLGYPAADPISVVYLDYEMTEDDLEERLMESMGYEPADLGNLHYYLLPSIPPLDTAAGGDVVMALVAEHAADVVVIDTTGRALGGEENSADTVRGYYRHTGLRLKQAGVASWRTDHSGKDKAKGTRGSSAKADDVDVAWTLSESSGVYTLRCDYSRVAWVPHVHKVRRMVEPVLRHTVEGGGGGASFPAGTKEAAADLDALGVPATASGNAAHRALKEAGKSRRRTVVLAAQRWRKAEAETGNHLGNHPEEGTSGTTPGTALSETAYPLVKELGTTTGTTGNHPPASLVPESGNPGGVPVGPDHGEEPTY